MNKRIETLGTLNNRCHGLHDWLAAMRTMGALDAQDQAWILMQAVSTMCRWIKTAAEEGCNDAAN